MIKLRDLQYLAAVDEHKHFGRAAEACFVSQPTLSGQIMKLEQQLDLTLIERHRRKVMLTPAGQRLVERARLVLKAADQFEEEAKALSDPLSGELHMGLIPTLAPYLLPHIMGPMREGLPNIDFYLHEDQTKHLLQALDSGQMDMLILPWLEQGMDEFERYQLFDEALVLATPCGHPLATKEPLSLEDLRDEQVLTLGDGHCLRDQALGYCFAAGAREDGHFRATSLETLRYMVASGTGITLLPQLAVSGQDWQQSRQMICYQPFQPSPPTREIVLLIRPNYPRMACVRSIVAAVRAAAEQF